MKGQRGVDWGRGKEEEEWFEVRRSAREMWADEDYAGVQGCTASAPPGDEWLLRVLTHCEQRGVSVWYYLISVISFALLRYGHSACHPGSLVLRGECVGVV